jgi:uncharacterized membrane protein YgcG
MKTSSCHHAMILAGVTLLGGALPGIAMDFDGLVKNSPFGQSSGGFNGMGNTKPGILEFRGMYVEGGVTYYSVYNNQTKQSSWVAPGKAPSGPVAVTVKEYDPVNEVLVIENAGQPVKLPLRQVTVGKVDAPQPVNMNFTPAAPQAAPATQNISDEKLQAFRDEMRKRFADRQNGNSGNGGDTNGGNFGGRGGRSRGGDTSNGGGGNFRGGNAPGNNSGAPN